MRHLRLVKRSEAARWLGVSPRTFKRLEANIPGFIRLSERISGWPEEKLVEFLEQHQVSA